MRFLSLVLIGWMGLAGIATAQEIDAAAVSSIAEIESFNVEISTYRVEIPIPRDTSADKLVKLLTQPAADQPPIPVETVRLTAISGAQSMVQFGRRVPVLSGSTVINRGPVARQFQTVELGTLARVMVQPQADKILVKLDLESTRLEGEGSDDTPPSTGSSQISTTVLLVPGEPTLLGGFAGKEQEFTIVTVSR